VDKGRNLRTFMFIRILSGDLGQPAHALQRPRQKKHVLAIDVGGTENKCSGGAAENT